MDTLNKILKALALLAIIIAAGVFTVTQLMGGAGQMEQSAPPQVAPAPDGPAPAQVEEPEITEPVAIPAGDSTQPAYKAVNQPKVLQNVRRKGKTYVSRTAGNLTGQASQRDWGFRGVATFNYTWGMESTAFVEKNDGLTIVEVRSFDKVVENVTVSDVGVGLDIPDDVGTLLDTMISLFGSPVSGVVQYMNKRSLSVPDWALNAMRKCNILPPEFDPNVLLNRMKMFTQQSGKYLLEGKKVRITFKDGQGIVRIEPVDGTALTQREIDVIKRSNFVMDHYLMPERNVAVGEKWRVPGNVFGGMVDPRLSGRLEGDVMVTREADSPMEDDSVASRLAVSGDKIYFMSQVDNMKQTGCLSSIKGSSLIPDSCNVVTEAELRGYAEYHEVSTDHLLFEANMSVTPSFRVRYTCEMKD